MQRKRPASKMLKIIYAEQKAIPEETMEMLKMENVAEEKRERCRRRNI